MPTTPAQMFANQLNPAKGWPSPVALDYRAKVSPTVLYNMVAGQVAYQNPADGLLLPGCIKHYMPLFLFQGVNELDVNNAIGTLTGVPPPSLTNPTQWVPVTPTGQILCLVGKGPYELETTEFNSALAYNRGDMLRAPTGVAANAYPGSGQLTNASLTLFSQTNTPQSSATACCGQVSRGVFKNSFGIPAIAFWPLWAPGNSSET